MAKPLPAESGPFNHAASAAIGFEQVWQAVMDTARETFSCDAVGLLLVTEGGLTVAAATRQSVVRANALQLSWGEGPCLEALRTGQPSIADDVRIDRRWRFWGPEAADLGFRSALSLPLVDGFPFGALSLYSGATSFFTADDVARGTTLAGHAGAALSRTRGLAAGLQLVDAG
jgi:GAF domain-containing protein